MIAIQLHYLVCFSFTGILRSELTINFLEGGPVDDDPEIVQEGEGHHHGPVVTEAAGGIEHKGPVRCCGPEPWIITQTSMLIAISAVTGRVAVLVTGSCS